MSDRGAFLLCELHIDALVIEVLARTGVLGKGGMGVNYCVVGCVRRQACISVHK